jgi:hypothetical protein
MNTKQKPEHKRNRKRNAGGKQNENEKTNRVKERSSDHPKPLSVVLSPAREGGDATPRPQTHHQTGSYIVDERFG